MYRNDSSALNDRAADAGCARHCEILAQVGADNAIEGFEIGTRGLPLHAAQCIHIIDRGGGAQRCLEFAYGRFEYAAIVV